MVRQTVRFMIAGATGFWLCSAATTATGQTLVERHSGSVCLPDGVTVADDYYTSASYGIEFGDNAALGAGVTCPIETNPTMYADDLDHVYLYYKITGNTGETVYGELMAHDSDSDSFCVCDIDTTVSSSNPQFFFHRLDLDGDDVDFSCVTDCLGGSVPSDWALGVDVLLEYFDAGTNRLTIKRVSVYD